MDMSIQLSATPAAKTLAVTDALAAPAAGVWPGSLKTDAHSPAMPHTSDAEDLELIEFSNVEYIDIIYLSY